MELWAPSSGRLGHALGQTARTNECMDPEAGNGRPGGLLSFPGRAALDWPAMGRGVNRIAREARCRWANGRPCQRHRTGSGWAWASWSWAGLFTPMERETEQEGCSRTQSSGQGSPRELDIGWPESLTVGIGQVLWSRVARMRREP